MRGRSKNTPLRVCQQSSENATWLKVDCKSYRSLRAHQSKFGAEEMNYENDKNRICICTSGSVRQRCNCANRRLACLGVRLCDDAKFDGEFESTGTAWPIFMTMLKRSAEAGVGSCTNATTFRFLDIPPTCAVYFANIHSVDPADQFPDDRPAARNRPQNAGAT